MSAVQKRIHEAALMLFAEKEVSEVNISLLAEAAGVARGTIYNNLQSIEMLFEKVAKELSEEMIQRVALSMPGDIEPAHRIAQGIRFYVRRAHEEPNWGKFLVRYGYSSEALKSIWSSLPAKDLEHGLNMQTFNFAPGQIKTILSVIAGAVLAAMILVIEGRQTWRDAGSDTAEMLLCALGLPRAQAIEIAHIKLPGLAAII